MPNERFASVWDAISNTPEQASNMKIRSNLMMQVRSYIETHSLTQANAASLFGVTQPRVSDLMRGKIDLFTIDTLVNMLCKAKLNVEVSVREDA